MINRLFSLDKNRTVHILNSLIYLQIDIIHGAFL